MSPVQMERLQEYLTRLRLFKSRERLDALLQEAAAKDLSYADFLDQVLGKEVASKAAKNITMRTCLARFQFVKSLDVFDFEYQPSLDKNQIQQLASCHLEKLKAGLVRAEDSSTAAGPGWGSFDDQNWGKLGDP